MDFVLAHDQEGAHHRPHVRSCTDDYFLVRLDCSSSTADRKYILPWFGGGPASGRLACCSFRCPSGWLCVRPFSLPMDEAHAPGCRALVLLVMAVVLLAHYSDDRGSRSGAGILRCRYSCCWARESRPPVSRSFLHRPRFFSNGSAAVMRRPGLIGSTRCLRRIAARAAQLSLLLRDPPQSAGTGHPWAGVIGRSFASAAAYSALPPVADPAGGRGALP